MTSSMSPWWKMALKTVFDAGPTSSTRAGAPHRLPPAWRSVRPGTRVVVVGPGGPCGLIGTVMGHTAPHQVTGRHSGKPLLLRLPPDPNNPGRQYVVVDASVVAPLPPRKVPPQ